MKIQYVHGNLLDTEIRHLLHSCNSRGVMRSGIAGALRDRYPEVYDGYREIYEKQNHSLELSQIIWVPTTDGKHVIANLIGQDDYGRDPKRVYADYHAIEIGMMRLDSYMEGYRAGQGSKEWLKVAMPLIGAGLARGDWTVISEIIERVSNNFEPVVYLLDGKIPGGR